MASDNNDRLRVLCCYFSLRVGCPRDTLKSVADMSLYFKKCCCHVTLESVARTGRRALVRTYIEYLMLITANQNIVSHHSMYTTLGKFYGKTN